jgi:hypothetical protein
VLLSRREREIRQAHAGITAAARWRPAVALGGRGARMAGQRGGERGQGHGEDDAWEEEKQEVDGGGLHSGGRRESCTGGRAGEAEEQRGFRGRRREGKGPKDLYAKLEDPKGLAVKQKWPLI